MEFNELKAGQTVWFNDSDNFQKSIIIGTCEYNNKRLVQIYDEEDDDYYTRSYEQFKDDYSLTKEEAFIKYGEYRKNLTSLIREIYELEKLFHEKIKQLNKVSHTYHAYNTIESIQSEKKIERFKKYLEDLCKRISIPFEFLDRGMPYCDYKRSVQERETMLERIGVYETDDDLSL